MTNWDAREVEIPLDFLGKGEYEARIFADGADAATEATSLAITERASSPATAWPCSSPPAAVLRSGSDQGNLHSKYIFNLKKCEAHQIEQRVFRPKNRKIGRRP